MNIFMSYLLPILLVCWSYPELASAISVKISPTTSLRLAPLIGGPKFLPIHIQVKVEQDHVFDFVPLNATEPETLQKLLQFQPVPGQIRYFDKRGRRSSRSVGDGGGDDDDDVDEKIIDKVRRIQQDFCEPYDTDLHLISNNCWTFAFQLIGFIEGKTDNKDKMLTRTIL